MENKTKILGIDIGISSIGWAYIEQDNDKIELNDCGVRIFTKAENPKTGASLALPRREARGVRRRLARKAQRLREIKRLICKEFKLNINDYQSVDGVLPKAYKTAKDIKSPYELRYLALSQKLEPIEFARVVLHIANHRGYGNKHARDDENDKESGKIKKAIKANENAQNKHLNVSEYIFKECYNKLISNKKVEFSNIINNDIDFNKSKNKDSTNSELETIINGEEFKLILCNDFIEKTIKQRLYPSIEKYLLKECYNTNSSNAANNANEYSKYAEQESIDNTLELIVNGKRQFALKFSDSITKDILKHSKCLSIEEYLLQECCNKMLNYSNIQQDSTNNTLELFNGKKIALKLNSNFIENIVKQRKYTSTEEYLLKECYNNTRSSNTTNNVNDCSQYVKRDSMNNTLELIINGEKLELKFSDKFIKAILRQKKYESIGEYLFKEFFQQPRDDKKGEFKNVRNRNKNKDENESTDEDKNKDSNYTQCMSQKLLKYELNLIFDRQRQYGLKFSDNFKKDILEVAFFQNPLKGFEDKVGDCIFLENEKRATKDSLSAIEFITLSRTINELKRLEKDSLKANIGEIYPKEKIQEIANIVLQKGALSYKQLREILNLDSKIKFKDPRLDYTKDKTETNIKFLEFKKLKDMKKAIGDLQSIDREILDNIARDVSLIKDKQKLLKKLESYPLDNTQRNKLTSISLSHTINLSLKALYAILPFMREGATYDEAVTKAGLKEINKNIKKDNLLPPLDYFEAYLANPVVLRALSEYRKVLNALIKKYGSMHKIHIELTREVGLSSKERQEYERKQKENYAANESARKQCEGLGLETNSKNLLKIKLWLEQGGLCIYSGEKIECEHLKDPTMLQVDHIYPYSRSYDDSYMNKVLVFTKENQDKKNKTPFEAFGTDSKKWETIKSTILKIQKKLPKQKIKKILNENFKDKEQGFIARNIVDTSYIARLALNYTAKCLEFLPLDENENTTLAQGEKGSKKHVEVISGSLTATMRHYLGLNTILDSNGDKKDRSNHLHHAIDAIVIAYMNAKTIKAFSDFKRLQEDNTAKFLAKKIEKSEFKGKKAFFTLNSDTNFRNMVKEKIFQIFVSKPPRKRARGELHQETFYSIDDKKMQKEYGGIEGIKRALSLGKLRQIGTKIVKNSTMVRTDIFIHKKTKKFYAVPIYTMDFALGILPNKAVVVGKKDGIIKEWIEMDKNYEFLFSIFKDDLLLIQRGDMEKPELCYFVSLDSSSASLEIAKHDNHFDSLTDNQKILFSKATQEKVVTRGIGIQNLKVFEKYIISPLGEYKKYEYTKREPIALKSSKKNKNN